MTDFNKTVSFTVCTTSQTWIEADVNGVMVLPVHSDDPLKQADPYINYMLVAQRDGLPDDPIRCFHSLHGAYAAYKLASDLVVSLFMFGPPADRIGDNNAVSFASIRHFGCLDLEQIIVNDMAAYDKEQTVKEPEREPRQIILTDEPAQPPQPRQAVIQSEWRGHPWRGGSEDL